MGQIVSPETLVFNLNQFLTLKMGQIVSPETLVFNLNQFLTLKMGQTGPET
jgi:hypothetical protein